MRTTTRIVVAPFAVVLLLLTGCSGDDPEPVPGVTNQPAVTSEPPSGDPPPPSPPAPAPSPPASTAPAAPTSEPPAPVPPEPKPPMPALEPKPVSRQLTIYFVALEDDGVSGYPIGCGDSVVAVRTEAVPSIAPVRESLERLFSHKEQYYGQSGLYNALGESNLTVEPNGLRIGENIVDVRLRGDVRIGGACDVPRIHEQIAFTAATAAGVDRARVYLNGTPFDEATSSR